MAPKKSRRSMQSHRSTLSLQKTEIIINVYDLLPPGRLSSFLWTVGTSLLHSGIVINGKEYAYGGHDRPGMTGVYWTKPRTEPIGGTFKCEILHGFSIAPEAEIDAIIRAASEEFQGTAYNLLTKNCNHFTAFLCQRLTGRAGPGWLNRAASIGVALPCVVPRDWIEPPDYETADGELLDEDNDHYDERSRMLSEHADRLHFVGMDPEDLEQPESEAGRTPQTNGKGKGKAAVRDSSGRSLPLAETAPTR